MVLSVDHRVQADQEDDPRAEALKCRAMAYQKLGRHQEALEDALAALNLDKSDVAALGLAACVALRGCLGWGCDPRAGWERRVV